MDTAKRLSGPATLAATAATVYTVPAAKTAILRHVRVANESAGAAKLTMSIGADAAGKRIYCELPIAAKGSVGSTLEWSGFMVLNAGEILQAYADIASVLTLTVSGVEVS